MIRATTPAEERLVAVAAAETRGPRRNGAYALWLVVRAAEALVPPGAVAARTHRRRLQAIASRLGGLALAPPLKRALAAACHHLEAGTPAAATLVLHQLVAPAREVLGPDAADALHQAARAARAAVSR
jgi:hypothetical protein